MSVIHSSDSILSYIKHGYDRYLQMEALAERAHGPTTDTRVHLCVYFLPPYGGHLRRVDLYHLKKLAALVPILPVLGKSDSLTMAEREALTRKVLSVSIRNDGDTTSMNGMGFYMLLWV